MDNFMNIGMDAFNDAIANGMDPGAAAQAAGNAASAAASEAGFPPEMIETAMNAGMDSFQANMDAGTVFFVLIPASKLSGDHEGDVAKWKGEVEAINTAQEKLKCK